jgi:hypothetical protein
VLRLKFALFLLTIVFFFLIPFLVRKYGPIKHLLYSVCFPVPNRFVTRIFIVALFVRVFVGIRFGFSELVSDPLRFFSETGYLNVDGEVFEFFAAYTFFAFSIMNSTKEIRAIES